MKNLKKLRQAANLSQTQLATLIGVSRSTIQRHERNGVKKERDAYWYKEVLSANRNI